VYIIHSRTLHTINVIIGWIYFVAWSVSFYPQVFYNYGRKSVVGLNFDFLAYNLTGFLGYSCYNVGIYWVASVQHEYTAAHHTKVMPVQANDVFFALHAVLITVVTIVQCLIYERGGQRVSMICKGLVSASWVFVGVSLILALSGKITALAWLNCFSYIKLGVTLIKYIPQAHMNYKRKSTVGWSIGNVLLDFTGGSLSLLQMVLQWYNNADPSIFIGDPTKLGLGFFSIAFDLLFMAQHYILYRKADEEREGYEKIIQ